MRCSVLLTSSTILALMGLTLAPSMRASVTFGTPTGALDPGGNPINATAIFQATSQTQLLITLTNNQPNPRDAGQMPTGFSFHITQNLAGVSMSSSAEPIDIGSCGGWNYVIEDAPHTESTYWDLTSTAGPSSTSFAFCDNPGLTGCTHRGSDWPERGLIGPPDAQNHYSNADGSITTGAHEPVLFETASFYINLPAGASLSSNLQVTNVTFAFGTLASPQTYAGASNGGSLTGTAVPEPGAGWLIAGGLALMAVGVAGRHRWSRKNTASR